MLMVQNSYDWLTSSRIWNARNQIEKAQEKLNGTIPSFMQKIQKGVKHGLSNFPKALILSCITGALLRPVFPQLSIADMSTCLQNNPPPLSPVGDLIFTPIVLTGLSPLLKTAVKAAWEEVIFRGAIQNLLGKLENSKWKMLSKMGSLTGRIAITSILFGAMHLGNLEDPCTPRNLIGTQVINSIVFPNLSILYETGGLAATTTAHIVNNLVPKLVLKLFQG